MSASMMQPNLAQLAGLPGVRAGALTRWQETGWPNSRVEQWRFTRLASLEKMDLRPALAAAVAGAAPISAKVPENSAILSFSNGVLDAAAASAGSRRVSSVWAAVESAVAADARLAVSTTHSGTAHTHLDTSSWLCSCSSCSLPPTSPRSAPPSRAEARSAQVSTLRQSGRRGPPHT